jgi:hypothetical protein
MAVSDLTIVADLGLPFTTAAITAVATIRERASELRSRSYARFMATERDGAAMQSWNRDTHRICAAEDAMLLALRNRVGDFTDRPAVIVIARAIPCFNGRIPAGRYRLKDRREGPTSARCYDLVGIGIADAGAIAARAVAQWLDDGTATLLDPGTIARERQLLQLRGAAPLRPHGAQHSADVTGLALFEPTLF